MSNEYLNLKIITVSRDHHLKLKNSDRLEFYQMIAKNVGIKNQIIVENGNVVLLKKNNSKIINNVKSGKLLLKGNQIFPQNDNLINNARIVSSEGEIFVNLILDLEKKLLNDPIIFCPTVTENVNLINQLKDVIKEELQRILKDLMVQQLDLTKMQQYYWISKRNLLLQEYLDLSLESSEVRNL